MNARLIWTKLFISQGCLLHPAYLFSDGNADEIVKRYAFGMSQVAGLLPGCRGKTKREALGMFEFLRHLSTQFAHEHHAALILQAIDPATGLEDHKFRALRNLSACNLANTNLRGNNAHSRRSRLFAVLRNFVGAPNRRIRFDDEKI